MTKMTEERAREILDIDEDGCLLSQVTKSMYFWQPGDEAVLRGQFTHEQLEAIAFWMRKYGSN